MAQSFAETITNEKCISIMSAVTKCWETNHVIIQHGELEHEHIDLNKQKRTCTEVTSFAEKGKQEQQTAIATLHTSFIL